MKNIKKKFFALLVLTSIIIGSIKSQQLNTLQVPNEVKNRMDIALQKANSMPLPDWCNTIELKQKRTVIIEKCIRTLYHNYIKPSGDIFHEGILPSPGYYNSLWSWDSWKHAYSLAYLDKDLAENSIRALYDYQNEEGMVADLVNVDKKKNNWVNTKSPLSAWAVFEVYSATNDLNFLKELYPKLLKYHYWWYKHRDVNTNGICEYGCENGKKVAAKWESWDEAIRQDSMELLKSKNNSYSMNIEAVDLNSYLYLEKEYLIKMASIIGDTKSAKPLQEEKKILGEKIRKVFYNKNDGFFYDVRLMDKSFIMSREACGWLPLFAGVATQEQAKSVKEYMMNETAFNAFLPLQTVSKDNPKYDPGHYWRGPVWLDQFYFGYMGLKKYGYKAEANSLLLKFIKNSDISSTNDNVLHEYYNSENGKGSGADYFGWTAAHLLMMMLDK